MFNVTYLQPFVASDYFRVASQHVIGFFFLILALLYPI
jgi:hypothetical protein